MTTHNLPPEEPTRGEVDQWTGPAVLEFGADWCPHCQAARPIIENALQDHPGVQHLRIADGPGRPLGRSYRVKLWPTLIVLRDGKEISRLVRPEKEKDIREALDEITDHR